MRPGRTARTNHQALLLQTADITNQPTTLPHTEILFTGYACQIALQWAPLLCAHSEKTVNNEGICKALPIKYNADAGLLEWPCAHHVHSLRHVGEEVHDAPPHLQVRLGGRLQRVNHIREFHRVPAAPQCRAHSSGQWSPRLNLCKFNTIKVMKPPLRSETPAPMSAINTCSRSI